eukprot:4627593-Amphidinium_carterae.1
MPIVHPVRVGPASSSSGEDGGLVGREPLLLRNGVIASLLVNVPGQLSQCSKSQPVALGRGILRGGSVLM